MNKFFLIMTFLFSFQSLWAVDKHPRVAELEDKIKKDADSYLEARFPGLPFSVTVSIDPLRRSFNSNYNPKGEVLPYYALDEENIQDEWDDPTVTLYSLINRVKKIYVTVQVPESLNEEELAEVKISLSQVLRLLPARDTIEITKRKWTLMPNLMTYALSVIGIILLLLLGMFIIAITSTKNVSKALENVQAYLKSGGGGMTPPKATSTSASQRNPGGSGANGDIRFNDPIKVREVALLKVDDIVKNKDLMRLENLRLLDEIGQDNPHALGALLNLFPIELQKNFFSFSNGSHWMEALSKPGELTLKTLETLEALGSVKTTEFRENWEKLLIQIWRMGHEASPFLKSMKPDEAMALLGSMPKFISLPLARGTFPGSWASLLDSRQEFKHFDDATCKELFEKSLKIMPLTQFEVLETYQKDMELLRYVEQADIRTEQEIYEASPADSMINWLRPPFYILFNQPQSILQTVANAFDIEDWATALFNVPRDQRKVVEKEFSEKEKFYYYELLQGLDKNNPNIQDVTQVRNQMARYLNEVLQNSSQDTITDNQEEPQQNDSNESAA